MQYIVSNSLVVPDWEAFLTNPWEGLKYGKDFNISYLIIGPNNKEYRATNLTMGENFVEKDGGYLKVYFELQKEYYQYLSRPVSYCNLIMPVILVVFYKHQPQVSKTII